MEIWTEVMHILLVLQVLNSIPIIFSKLIIASLFQIDDFTFIVGASCWENDQLESEVAKGYWLPCSGPPSIAMTGQCQHDDEFNEGNTIPAKSDLWLSMMCAISNHEARLANLLFEEKHSENGDACDEFR